MECRREETQFSTHETAEMYIPPVGNPPDYINTAGYSVAGDRGGARHVYVPSASSGDLNISDGVSTFYYVVKHDFVAHRCSARLLAHRTRRTLRFHALAARQSKTMSPCLSKGRSLPT